MIPPFDNKIKSSAISREVKLQMLQIRQSSSEMDWTHVNVHRFFKWKSKGLAKETLSGRETAAMRFLARHPSLSGRSAGPTRENP
ncbi:MAG: hypothetical protein WCG76_10890, partial [Verrucomicrobiota bacterium]